MPWLQAGVRRTSRTEPTAHSCCRCPLDTAPWGAHTPPLCSYLLRGSEFYQEGITKAADVVYLMMVRCGASSAAGCCENLIGGSFLACSFSAGELPLLPLAPAEVLCALMLNKLHFPARVGLQVALMTKAGLWGPFRRWVRNVRREDAVPVFPFERKGDPRGNMGKEKIWAWVVSC